MSYSDEIDIQEHDYWRAFCPACGTSPCQWNGVPDGFHTDDPPEYDPYDTAADQAEDHAAAQRELAAIEAEEARGLASCGHLRNEDGECDCSSWPERASNV